MGSHDELSLWISGDLSTSISISSASFSRRLHRNRRIRCRRWYRQKAWSSFHRRLQKMLGGSIRDGEGTRQAEPARICRSGGDFSEIFVSSSHRSIEERLGPKESESSDGMRHGDDERFSKGKTPRSPLPCGARSIGFGSGENADPPLSPRVYMARLSPLRRARCPRLCRAFLATSSARPRLDAAQARYLLCRDRRDR